MSLDLVLNALYQGISAGIPGLTFYPEVYDAAAAVFPNLSVVELPTTHLPVRSYQSVVEVATGLILPAAPWSVYPVIGNEHSDIRLEYRDSLGRGPKDNAGYNVIRARHNQIMRYFAEPRMITIGAPPGPITNAQVQLASARKDHDARADIFRYTYAIGVDWYLTTELGQPTFQADTITIDLTKLDGTLIVEEVLT